MHEGVEPLEALAAPFWAQGAQELYVSRCCGKLFVGLAPPVRCRVCQGKPNAVKVTPATINEV